MRRDGLGTLQTLARGNKSRRFGPFSSATGEISADRSGLDQVLATGRERASAVAEQTLQRVQEAMGFARPATAN